jgi:hypothetical protein
MCRFDYLTIPGFSIPRLFLLGCMTTLFVFNYAAAQDDLLKKVGGLDLGGIFEDEMKAVARLLSETDELLNIEVKYEGFTEASQYIIRGEILNSKKKGIKEITAVKRSASKGSGSVDLGFRLKLDSNKSYEQAYLESAFLKITIYDAEEEDGIIEIPGVETILLSGNTYLFEYQKKWRVGGSSKMVIPVSLTPIGKAKN